MANLGGGIGTFKLMQTVQMQRQSTHLDDFSEVTGFKSGLKLEVTPLVLKLANPVERKERAEQLVITRSKSVISDLKARLNGNDNVGREGPQNQ